MALIKSISGIRGTIGGVAGDNFTPEDIILYTSSFVSWLRSMTGEKKLKVVVGRDARISGDIVNRLVCGTLMAAGADVIDTGLSTTPTVELAVTHHAADGGIIITASHNPKEWNALKLLNRSGEFLDNTQATEVLKIADGNCMTYPGISGLGNYSVDTLAIERHIDSILKLTIVDKEAIAKAELSVTIDGVNSTGGIAVPKLLKALGIKTVHELYCKPDGRFPHNPEPLPENLNELSATVVQNRSQIGFAVDPDVDRLAIVCEDGGMFGEEYTLVAIADYILSRKAGNTVSNLSSSSALRDVTIKAGGKYFASAVGEVNVVEMMKTQQAVIGGEGNGGVIFPELHYGRDALVGIALFLSHLVLSGKTCSVLRTQYPSYFMSKNKIEMGKGTDIKKILEEIRKKYGSVPQNTIDGIRLDFGPNEWVHLRGSNTEPIIRIYSESDSQNKSEHLVRKLLDDIRDVINPEPED